MAGQENLKFIKSTEEAREKGRAGGIASGKARRRKRAMREAADLFLSLPVTDRRKLKKLKAKELDEEDIDQQMAMIAGLVEAAQNGDAACANVIVKLLGEALPGTDSTDELEKAAQILGGVESVIE
ncbi:MAG TPA: hypothetical protein H9698_10470 [Candidatus Ruthenibacterium merdavium]|uniref:Uncharacterized protein n=1 Tax=Candidatus Ruthenibacterium merdavium TaxID=2838752 RepID=A0A9D2TLT7_9FIRM|nr:hypothetical protein [Candidatus Ruthenibacterium merdavium]